MLEKREDFPFICSAGLEPKRWIAITASDLNQTKGNEKNRINVCTKLCTLLVFYKGINYKSQESLQISIKSQITV